MDVDGKQYDNLYHTGTSTVPDKCCTSLYAGPHVGFSNCSLTTKKFSKFITAIVQGEKIGFIRKNQQICKHFTAICLLIWIQKANLMWDVDGKHWHNLYHIGTGTVPDKCTSTYLFHSLFSSLFSVLT